MDQVSQAKIIGFSRGFCAVLCCCLCCGCAAVSSPVLRGKPVETVDQQLDAAQKVLGGMAGHEVSREQMNRVAQDMQKNPETRSAVGKIIGAQGVTVIKYSPVTGKHYSGDLDIDPETGVKLEVLPE